MAFNDIEIDSNFTQTDIFNKCGIQIFDQADILKAANDKKKYDQIKRIIDIILSIFAIVLFSPLLSFTVR